MNYEELYGALAPLEKRIKDLAASLQKNVKSIGKNTENGDLKALAKDLAALSLIHISGLLKRPSGVGETG